MTQPTCRLHYMLVWLFASALTSCSSTEDAQRTRIVLTGSSTIAPLVLEIGKRFESEHPGVRIDVQTGGASRGVSDVRRGLSDIGMVSRTLKPEESSELQAFAIAHDGVGLIIHRDNPVQSLTDAQVVAIFTGKVENWAELGGNDAPITVVNKAEGRSTLELFLDYYQLNSADVQADVVIGDNEQGIKTVAGNPHAIGYVSIGTAEFDVTVGIPIRLLPIGGVEATVENVARGGFPLSRPLNLVTRPSPSELVRAFIEYAQSEAVHDLIQEQYFVPITP